MENGAKMNFILNAFQMKCNIFTVSLEKLIRNTSSLQCETQV